MGATTFLFLVFNFLAKFASSLGKIKSEMSKVYALYGSKRQDPYLAEITGFLQDVLRRGDRVVMHPKLFNYLKERGALPSGVEEHDSPTLEADIAVSLGGDGSFLRTAAWVAHSEIPILGVNTGHLGFLASCDISGLSSLPDIIDRGDYALRCHSLIEVVEPRVIGWPYALNEVTVTKGDGASIVNVAAKINGEDLANYRADGLIVSTPTGSTAYNLSVGGPIVQPTAPVFVLSPIAAHSLSMRPFVIDDTSVLVLDCDSRFPKFRLTLDGRATDLPQGTRVVLAKARFVTKAVVLPGHNFAKTLREKLSWG